MRMVECSLEAQTWTLFGILASTYYCLMISTPSQWWYPHANLAKITDLPCNSLIAIIYRWQLIGPSSIIDILMKTPSGLAGAVLGLHRIRSSPCPKFYLQWVKVISSHEKYQFNKHHVKLKNCNAALKMIKTKISGASVNRENNSPELGAAGFFNCKW